MKRKKTLSFLLSTTLFFVAAAQPVSDLYLTPDKLSNPHVNVLVEDNDGYIWAGTSRGLNRYNGSTYTYYFYAPDGLSSDNITTLAPDTEGRMGRA